MKSNILLIGFMGVGKGRTARELSRVLGKYAIDTDDLIESLENKKIKDIFKENGEQYFRDLEKKTATWLEGGVNNSIISCGGGFFMVPNIKNIGTIVHLHSSFDAILEKIYADENSQKKLKKRPLLKNKKDAKKLFDEREEAYRMVADFTIDVEGKNVADCVKEIIGKL